MIELTLKQIRDQQFGMAVEKLMNNNQLPAKTSYNFSRIGSKIRTEARDAHDQFVKLVRKHGDVDEKTGNFTIREENMDDWKKELSEFDAIKVTIDRNKIAFSEISKAQLSPNDILALEPLLHELEIVEGGTHEKA